jgi:predicted TIM-barrel fold metal-dependent hydrolase
MKTSILFSLSAFAYTVSSVYAQVTETTIINDALADGIDLHALDSLAPGLLDSALDAITATYALRKRTIGRVMPRQLANGDRIDVHSHVVPDWYRTLVPTTGGNPTPQWTLQGHFDHMTARGIERSVISISSPGAGVVLGNQGTTVALARLLNEQLAAYAQAHPDKFSWFAVVPLPYTQNAIVEATHALDVLGASGIVLLSNFEGRYLGDPDFKPFFEAINNRGGRQVLFVHPTTPYLKIGNDFVECNPTIYPTGIVEFYFETARTFMSLTLTQTIHNFTNIHYVVPHTGGSFPAILDRFLKTNPALYNPTIAVFAARLWWDSAGPTYYHQISGLLGYNFPKSQLLFGTDFPYAPSFSQGPSLDAILASPLLTDAEKIALFTTNACTLFAGLIPC